MIANPPPSPLHVSELGKFEESDLTPEMMTAKNEHVTVSPRSWELTQGWWSSIGSLGTAPRPRPSPAVLLGKPAQQPACSPGPGGAAAWPTVSCLHPPGATSLAANRGHGARVAPRPGEHPPPLPTFQLTSMSS